MQQSFDLLPFTQILAVREVNMCISCKKCRS